MFVLLPRFSRWFLIYGNGAAPFRAWCLPVTKRLRKDQARPGCRPSVRLPILEYHDLTLSRFSRYVWEAVHRSVGPRWTGGPGSGSGPGSLYAHILQSPGGRAGPGTHGTPNLCRYLTLCCVQKSEEIKMTKSAPAGVGGQAGTGRPGQVGNRPILTGCYWPTVGGALAQFRSRNRGMWKWLTADQVDREIPFLQHLWWIVSGSSSVFLWQGNAGGMRRQPQGPVCSLRGLLCIERDSPCQLNSDSHLSRSQLFLSPFATKSAKTHKSSRVTLRGPDWTQRFPVSRKTRLILDLEDYNYVVSLLGCNNPGHWVLTRHHPISNTSSNKLGRSRFLPKTPDKWHYAGSWKHTENMTPDALQTWPGVGGVCRV